MTHTQDLFDPMKWARQGHKVEGELPLAKMPRLQDCVLNNSGTAKVSLSAGIDRDQYPWIKGQVAAMLVMKCQCCNEAFDLPLNLDVAVSPIVSAKQAQQLPAYYEGLVTNGELVSLNYMVEEELLLGLPMVPKHEHCGENHGSTTKS